MDRNAKIKELFSEFCAGESPQSRYTLHVPFPHGKHVYATNGRVLIRIDSHLYRHALTVPGDKPFPTPEEPWFDRATYRDESIELPEQYPHAKCEDCKGTGTLPDGDACCYCDGWGDAYEPPVHLFHGITLNARYLDMVHRHGGAVFLRRDHHAMKVVWLEFEALGVVGVLMPIERMGSLKMKTRDSRGPPPPRSPAA